MIQTILVKPERPEFQKKAAELAMRLQVSVFDNKTRYIEPNAIIIIDDKGIALQISSQNKEKPIFIDFCSEKMLYRQRNSGTRKEAIARAVGLKTGQPLNILDATAGLGGDSFILSSLGANVTMLERNKLIHLLLEDAMLRAASNEVTADIISRMRLLNADSIQFLQNVVYYPSEGYGLRPDVVYMDPMFPDKTKTALNKKEMRVFREIAGADEDIRQLLENALKVAKKRVVIKRPRNSSYVNSLVPDFAVEGKSSRFDVYITAK